MKRFCKSRAAAVLAAAAFTAAAADAQVTDNAAYREGNMLNVKLAVYPGIRLSANERMTVTPVITDGERQVAMESVLYTGRVRRKVSERRERLYGTPAVPDGTGVIILVNRNRRRQGENTIPFEGSVPYEEWMGGGMVMLYREMEGCGERETIFPAIAAAEITAPVKPRLSFLISPDTGAKRRIERITAVVHFPQGSSELLPGFADNTIELRRIDSLTSRLTDNGYVTVDYVSLDGYASPEDTYTYNTRLSADRVRAIRDYLSGNFDIPEGEFRTHSVPEDWDSLRRWVAACDMPARQQILEAIDDTSDPDARDAAIRRIDGGRSYRELLHDAYPQLRRVDYAIGYTVRPFTGEQCRQLVETHPEWLSPAEFCRLAESYPEGSPERERICRLAVEYHPDDMCACCNMAALEMRRGDAASARRYLGRFAEDPRALNNLAILCLQEGDSDGARRLLSMAAESGSQEAEYNLAYFDRLECEW